MINFIAGLLIGICIGALIMAKVTLKILDSIDDWQQLSEYLNDNYTIALSNLEDYDEI